MEKLVFAFILMATIAALYLSYSYYPQTIQYQSPSPLPTLHATARPTQADGDFILIKLLGVDEKGNGQIAELTIEAVPGSGKVFIAFSQTNPVLQDETQSSLKTAVALGKRFATTDVNAVDLRFSMTAPSASVGGKSAGAAMALGTIALLTKNKLRPEVAITGGIDEAGRITKVGGVLAKAKAAKQAGFTKMLVPVGEGKAFIGKEECFDETVNGETLKRCIVKNVAVSVGDEAGIEVIEVKDVVDALKEMSE